VLRRLWEKLKELWRRAKSERASPREIGWAVAIGAFSGCTPAIGTHTWVALGLATLLKKNRLFAWLGSRISNMVMLPFIALAEVQVAHRLRTGEWLVIDRHAIIEKPGPILLDWCLGTIPVGGAIALAMGMMAYGIAHARDRRREKAEEAAAKAGAEATPASPAEPPRPSSGSTA